jgi:hypothetical protein
MFNRTRAVGQLAEQLTSEVPLIREQLQQVAEDAGRSFSRLEDAATAATTLLVVLTVAVVAALFLSTVCVVGIRRLPL